MNLPLSDAIALLAEAQIPLNRITIGQFIGIFYLGSTLKEDIAQAQSLAVTRGPAPIAISTNLIQFISDSINLEPQVISQTWRAMKDIIWDYNAGEILATSLRMFQLHGWEEQLMAQLKAHHTVFPPDKYVTCPTNGCDPNRPLTEAVRKQVVLYTETGPVPAHTIYRKCRNCRTSYHPDYSVKDSVRTYYDNLDLKINLQIGEHQYMEIGVIVGFINAMVFCWTSATNCARWYNETFQNRYTLPLNWPCGFRLDTNHVWDAFILLGLLNDHNGRAHLTLPHDGPQEKRFDTAMKSRNDRIIQLGQPELSHGCDVCVKKMYDPIIDKTVVTDAIVSDGITLGHFCCGVRDCQEALASNRDDFCPTHAQLGLTNICRVVGCNRVIRGLGFKSCNDPQHSSREDALRRKGTAAFQLKARLERTMVAHPNDSVRSAEVAPDEVSLADEDCDIKSTEGNTNLTALFSRRRTHNEQLMIRPCGIIIARSTFYGSEAISNVADMLRQTCRRIGLPSLFIYDNNCSLFKHLQANKDTTLSDVGMPVDVFHFRSKHTVNDLICQQHCNPAHFPALLAPDGETWIFNTSIAEQVNVWMGGYHSIVREMKVTKYRFFLDEMILRRNMYTVEKLTKDGRKPRYRTLVARA